MGAHTGEARSALKFGQFFGPLRLCFVGNFVGNFVDPEKTRQSFRQSHGKARSETSNFQTTLRVATGAIIRLLKRKTQSGTKHSDGRSTLRTVPTNAPTLSSLPIPLPLTYKRKNRLCLLNPIFFNVSW